MMFSFGLFATHTPYLVLAALYVCYLGSWIISSLFPQLPVDVTSPPPQHTIAVEQTVTSFGTDYKNSYDSFHFSKNFAGLILKIFTLRVNGSAISICPHTEPYKFILHIWDLYNRPPPSFS